MLRKVVFNEFKGTSRLKICPMQWDEEIRLKISD